MEQKLEAVKHAKSLIGNGKTSDAIKSLESITLGKFESEVLLLKGRFSKIRLELNKGTIDDRDARIEINKINDSLLYVCDQILAFEAKRKESLAQRKPIALKFIGAFVLILSLVGLGFQYVIIPKKNLKECNSYLEIGNEQLLNKQLVSAIESYDKSIKCAEDSKLNNIKKEAIEKRDKAQNLLNEYTAFVIDADSLLNVKDYVFAKSFLEEALELNVQDANNIRRQIMEAEQGISALNQIDIGIESLEGEVYYKSIAPTSAQIKIWNWEAAFNFTLKVANYSNSEVTYQISIESRNANNKKAWSNFESYNATINPGSIDNFKKEIVFKLADWPGTVSGDKYYGGHEFKICIKNILDVNAKNDCIEEVFVKPFLSY